MPPTFVGATGTGSTAATTTLTLPSGLQVGDVMLLAVTSHDSVAITTPTGWALLGSGEGNAPSYDTLVRVYIKTATADDVAAGSVAVVRTAGSTPKIAVACAAYRGALSTPNVWARNVSGTYGTTATAPAVTTTVADTRVVNIFGAFWETLGAYTVTPNAPLTTRVTVPVADSGSSSAIGDETYAAAGTTTARTASWGANRGWVAFTVALAPGAVADAETAQLAATAPSVTGSLAGTVAVAPISAQFAATAPGVTGVIAAELVGVVTGNLAGVAPAVFADVAAIVSPPPAPTVETSAEFANDGYNYDGTAAVYFEPPIAEPPAHIRRVKVMQVHQSMSAPVLVNGRPT